MLLQWCLLLIPVGLTSQDNNATTNVPSTAAPAGTTLITTTTPKPLLSIISPVFKDDNTTTEEYDGNTTKITCISFGYLGPVEIARMSTGCTSIKGHVRVLRNDVPYSEMERVFSTVTYLEGCITICNTNYQNFSFFRNVQHIVCKNNEVQALPQTDGFAARNNAKLLTVGLDSLVDIQIPSGSNVMVIGSTKMCFSVRETEVLPLTAHETMSKNCPSLGPCYVEPTKDKKDGSQIPIGCKIISWSVVLEGNVSQEQADRLGTVRFMIDILQVKNTTLKHLNLSSLQSLTSNKGFALAIVNNNFLEEVMLPKLDTIHGGVNDQTGATQVSLLQNNTLWTVGGIICQGQPSDEEFKAKGNANTYECPIVSVQSTSIASRGFTLPTVAYIAIIIRLLS